MIAASSLPSIAKQCFSTHAAPALQLADDVHARPVKIDSSGVQPVPNQSQNAPSALPSAAALPISSHDSDSKYVADCCAAASQTGGVTYSPTKSARCCAA